MSGKLAGRVAIVTGAARGQGEATARLFAAEGAHVIVADVSEAEGRAVAAAIGGGATFAHLDVTAQHAWEDLVAVTEQQHGSVDILVNNAGIVQPSTILDLEKDQFLKVLEINLIGAWLGIRAAGPGMMARKRGSIVNIISTSGLWGMNGLVSYSSSKWALRGMTKTAAMELGPHGIRVNAVFPGGVNTRMGNVTNEPTEELSKYYQAQPIKRIGEPHEVARVSLFLASDDSSYLCGAEIAVDGGMTLGVFNDFLPHP